MEIHSWARSAVKVGVFGSDSDHCTPDALAIAEEVGMLLAQRDAIVFTGGGLGVMEAASKGAAMHGGLVIGLLPGDQLNEANAYCSIALPTGIGFARGQILTNSVDGAILVEGGLGTQSEAACMYWLKKPTVAVTSSGGVAQAIANKPMDQRNFPPILGAETAQAAVELLFTEINHRK